MYSSEQFFVVHCWKKNNTNTPRSRRNKLFYAISLNIYALISTVRPRYRSYVTQSVTSWNCHSTPEATTSPSCIAYPSYSPSSIGCPSYSIRSLVEPIITEYLEQHPNLFAFNPYSMDTSNIFLETVLPVSDVHENRRRCDTRVSFQQHRWQLRIKLKTVVALLGICEQRGV